MGGMCSEPKNAPTVQMKQPKTMAPVDLGSLTSNEHQQLKASPVEAPTSAPPPAPKVVEAASSASPPIQAPKQEAAAVAPVSEPTPAPVVAQKAASPRQQSASREGSTIDE